jgi:DNA-binding transcriptional MocR family regulator
MIDQMFPTKVLQKHIADVLQPQYSLRYAQLLSAIKEHLVPLGVTVPAPTAAAGGYFIWLTLPAPLRASDVVQRAQAEEKLRLAAGDLFQIPGDAKAGAFSDHLRLCFAWEEQPHLEEGVRRLARVLKRIVS